MDVGHNPTCTSTLTLAAVGSKGCCKSFFGYFSAPRFSNSLSIKTQNSKSYEHITMLKQGLKTINAEFIRTYALSQLSFVQFRPYSTLFVELLFSLTLCQKIKRPWRWAWTLHLCSRPPLTVDTRVEGLVSNVDYLENWYHNFIQNKYGRKRHLSHTHVSFSGL